MSKQSYFLLGWILALFVGVSWGLGHETKWVSSGVFFGVMIPLILSCVVFAISLEEDDA